MSPSATPLPESSNRPDASWRGSTRDTSYTRSLPVVVATARKRGVASRCTGSPSDSPNPIVCFTVPLMLCTVMAPGTQAYTLSPTSAISAASTLNPATMRAAGGAVALPPPSPPAAAAPASPIAYTSHAFPFHTSTCRAVASMPRMFMAVRTSARAAPRRGAPAGASAAVGVPANRSTTTSWLDSCSTWPMGTSLRRSAASATSITSPFARCTPSTPARPTKSTPSTPAGNCAACSGSHSPAPPGVAPPPPPPAAGAAAATAA